MSDARLNPSLIEARFVEAADVLRRLPGVRVPGYFNTWPTMMREFSDLVGQEPRPMRRPPPPADAISRMEETLEWLRWLEPQDAKIVWLRASGDRWKAICWKVGLQRSAANERWLYALCVVAWRLSGGKGRPVTSKRRLIEGVRQKPGGFRK
ncbi:DUF6362 family protein [Bradyrhizobium sp. HKCCYLS2038]|uniref:DUF6362 family protein n=1 Tax=Bradyrhizobium sp. HKCCYLS2038 TaxID=3420764 RepID=UPI003EC04F25